MTPLALDDLESDRELDWLFCHAALDDAWPRNPLTQAALSRAMDHYEHALDLEAQIEQLRTAA